MSNISSSVAQRIDLRESPIISVPSYSPQGQYQANTMTAQKPLSSPGTHTPKVRLFAVYSLLFLTPILGAISINALSAKNTSSSMVSPAAETEAMAQRYEEVIPVSAQALKESSLSPQSNDYEYELSLANGFLRKAVDLSNTSEVQTSEEKQKIVDYLTQALEAANRAIALHPEDSRGYTARGRVYQASSVVKPEMKELADADFAKAQELGSTTPTSADTATNPVEFLPTEQAVNTLADTAVIAAPSNAEQTELSTETSGNIKEGKIMLTPGQTEIAVPYSEITAQTRIFVEAEQNPENIVLYVKNKEEGKGFVIAATSAPTSSLDITWKEIQ